MMRRENRSSRLLMGALGLVAIAFIITEQGFILAAASAHDTQHHPGNIKVSEPVDTPIYADDGDEGPLNYGDGLMDSDTDDMDDEKLENDFYADENDDLDEEDVVNDGLDGEEDYNLIYDDEDDEEADVHDSQDEDDDEEEGYDVILDDENAQDGEDFEEEPDEESNDQSVADKDEEEPTVDSWSSIDDVITKDEEEEEEGYDLFYEDENGQDGADLEEEPDEESEDEELQDKEEEVPTVDSGSSIDDVITEDEGPPHRDQNDGESDPTPAVIVDPNADRPADNSGDYPGHLAVAALPYVEKNTCSIPDYLRKTLGRHHAFMCHPSEGNATVPIGADDIPRNTDLEVTTFIILVGSAIMVSIWIIYKHDGEVYNTTDMGLVSEDSLIGDGDGNSRKLLKKTHSRKSVVVSGELRRSSRGSAGRL